MKTTKEFLPSYHAMPEILDLPGYSSFHKDGAYPHQATAVQWCWDAKPLQCWTGRGCPMTWLERSSDLTPLGFFTWGYKQYVISVQIKFLCHMKRND